MHLLCPRKESSQTVLLQWPNGMAEKRRAPYEEAGLHVGAAITLEGCTLCSDGMGGIVKCLSRNKARILLCMVYKEKKSLF